MLILSFPRFQLEKKSYWLEVNNVLNWDSGSLLFCNHFNSIPLISFLELNYIPNRGNNDLKPTQFLWIHPCLLDWFLCSWCWLKAENAFKIWCYHLTTDVNSLIRAFLRINSQNLCLKYIPICIVRTLDGCRKWLAS